MNTKKYFLSLAVSILLGLVFGLLISSLFKSLYWIQDFQHINSYYIFLLPFVWLILKLIKKSTLYFPISTSEARSADASTYKYWNKWGLIFNFLGTLLGLFSGASIGREGAAVVVSSQAANLLRLDWNYWRGIVIASSFAIAVGQPWVSVVFLIEMFSTSLIQKIFTLIVAWIGSLVLTSFQVPHLLKPFFILGVDSFFKKLLFVFICGAVVGVLAKIYKNIFFSAKEFFDKKSIWIGFILLIAVSMILYMPQFKNIHSLSLELFKEIQFAQISVETLSYKIIFTLFFVSIGYWGGDFVPSILIGCGLGAVIARAMSIDPMFGVMIGSFMFFCGLTRLKWTALFLTGAVIIGWNQLLWVYLALTVCRQFSGKGSIYFSKNTAF